MNDGKKYDLKHLCFISQDKGNLLLFVGYIVSYIELLSINYVVNYIYQHHIEADIKKRAFSSYFR